MAEAYLKSLHLKDVAVLSSGTAADIYRQENLPRIPHITARLSKYGISEFIKTTPDQLTQERIDRANITVCMNQIVADEGRTIVTMPPDTLAWNVEDSGEGRRTIKPGEDSYKYTEEIYQEIKNNVDKLVSNLNLSNR
jgi:protein-tyrosine-phosphatase